MLNFAGLSAPFCLVNSQYHFRKQLLLTSVYKSKIVGGQLTPCLTLPRLHRPCVRDTCATSKYLIIIIFFCEYKLHIHEFPNNHSCKKRSQPKLQCSRLKSRTYRLKRLFIYVFIYLRYIYAHLQFFTLVNDLTACA